MSSERLLEMVDAVANSRPPIDRLIARVKEEKRLGYYKEYDVDEVFNKVIKWAEKYQKGEV